MDGDQVENSSALQNPGDEESRSAVNSLILDYYKKFGRKRDLEQYFSLSTAQSDIRDPTSLFWAKMKTENESSDSGERSDNKKSESSQEICRISIRFPGQDPCSSQDEETKTKTESVSPPIIIEELPQDSRPNSDDEAMKSYDGAKTDDDGRSDDNNSQKSYDVLLDTSLNKLHSPSSSITSQRRLEWDSLADVGYANESDRKTSASSLSTLERLALKQQYSNNDTQQNSNLGVPTAHSTPLDDNEAKSKVKKGVGKKTTKIYKKDVDLVEVNVPHSSNMNPAQSINVNLTKHISFNVEKDGKVTIDNIQKNISVSPEKSAPEVEIYPRTGIDRDVQTSLPKSTSNVDENVTEQQKIPILISLNTLKSRVRRRRLRMARKKQKTKKRQDKENIPVQEKSGEQLSEAESFEYMPGHMYNQNQMTANSSINRPNVPDNKSSLESSGVPSSDSSKGSKHSFTKDLEKSIDLLKAALQKRCDDASLRKQLIQQVCQRLLNSQYRDDDSTTDFLSGLSFGSKKLGLGEPNNTTTSTSDANNSAENTKRPKKSILRTEKFNAGSIASTSQSVPNLPMASNSDKLVTSNLAKNITLSNTESDVSSKNNTSSDNGVAKTSSEELYKKYLQALKREEAYKKHLKDKEMFLKQKLVASDSAFKVPMRVEVKPSTASSRLKDLIHDLTRNNYDDGSGDASKLEGGISSQSDFGRVIANRNQRSHSVFTLSSGLSEGQNKKPNLKKRLQCDLKEMSKPGTSKDAHYCCCPHHGKLKFADSCVQVNIKKPCNLDTCPEQIKSDNKAAESPRKLAKIIADDATGNLEYVCLCNKDTMPACMPDDFLIYKCSRLNNKGIQLEEASSKSSTATSAQCNDDTCPKRVISLPQNKSSQTDMLIKMMNQLPNTLACGQGPTQKESDTPLKCVTSIYESTRWIQTEISINPKIAEPTLSDINIVSDTNCARLICENRREVSKPSLTDFFSTQAVASSSTGLSSNKSTGSSKCAGIQFKDDDSTPKSKETMDSVPSSNVEHIEHTEKFTIPIQGTNMTLMVSLGSEQALNPNAKEMVTLGIGTEKVQAIEQATSVLDECSRGVQADEAMKCVPANSKKDENKDQNKAGCSGMSQNLLIRGTPLSVNTCIADKNQQCGTYPKTCPVNENKLLRRANTDTDKIQTVAFCPKVEEQTINTATSCSKMSKCSRATSPNRNSDLTKNHECPCGCKGIIDKCKLKCRERQLMESNNNVDKSVETCPCGSGNPKDTCKECSKKPEDTAPSKSSLAKKFESKGTNPDETLNDQTDKCSCGCGGDINNCKKKCKEAAKREFGTQPIEQAAIQTSAPIPLAEASTSNYLIEKRSCSCGCGGSIDNCKKNCSERIKQSTDMQTDTFPCVSSVTRQVFYGKSPLDREIDTQTDMSQSIRSEKCACGCGDTKDKCKRSCKELKVPCIDRKQEQASNRRYSSPKRDDRFMSEDRRGSSPGRIETRTPQYRRASSPRQEGGRIPPSRKDMSPRKQDKYTPQYRRLSSPNARENRSPQISRESSPTLARRKSYMSGRDSAPKDKENRIPQYRRLSSPRERNECQEHQTREIEIGSCGMSQTDKDINTQTDDFVLDFGTCSCGCGGPRSECKNSCTESLRSNDTTNKRKTNAGTECSTNDCVEPKLSPTEPIKNIIVNTAQGFPDKYLESCSCGCGKTKDKCSKKCKDVSSSPRDAKCNEPNQKKEVNEPTRRKEYKEPTQQKEIGIQKNRDNTPPSSSRSKRSVSPKTTSGESKSEENVPIKKKPLSKPLNIVDNSDPADGTSSSKGKKSTTDSEPTESGSDPIINMIQNITKKYAKKDVEKNKRKKCYKEIMSVLNYLLETDEDPEGIAKSVLSDSTKLSSKGSTKTNTKDSKNDKKNTCASSTSNDETDTSAQKTPEKENLSKKVVDRGVQQSLPSSSKKSNAQPMQSSCSKKSKPKCGSGTESSEFVTSTEMPGTSSDSATCKVLNKIKKECERYHQKRCKLHSGNHCDGTSSTSVNCDKCRRVHHCSCRSHKCKNHKRSNEKICKTPVAYNLILQTSESIMSDGPSSCCERTRQLKNIIVKVPKKKPPPCMPFGEIAAKFERQMPCHITCNVQKDTRPCRSKSLPNESEISSMDEIIRQSQGATVREYLERNRPDFIEKCNERQTCMRYISESRCEDPKAPTRLKMVIVHTPKCTGSCNPFYAGVQNVKVPCVSTQCFSPRIVNVESEVTRIACERAAKRELLSVQLAHLPHVAELEGEELRRLASELGRYMRHTQPAPKFINEREMKKHSEKIYKSLPEVVQKKEEQKKENTKKTNLLMANIFKRGYKKRMLRRQRRLIAAIINNIRNENYAQQ